MCGVYTRVFRPRGRPEAERKAGGMKQNQKGAANRQRAPDARTRRASPGSDVGLLVPRSRNVSRIFPDFFWDSFSLLESRILTGRVFPARRVPPRAPSKCGKSTAQRVVKRSP